MAELLLKDDDDGQNSDGNELAEDFAHEVHAHQGHDLPDDVNGEQAEEDGNRRCALGQTVDPVHNEGHQHQIQRLHAHFDKGGDGVPEFEGKESKGHG